MTIYDQFEYYANAALSGSYSDNIMFGPTPIQRTYVGSIAAGFDQFDGVTIGIRGFNSGGTNIPSPYRTMSASYYDLQKSFRRAGSQRTTLKMFTANEEFYDSFMPDPVKCYQTGAISQENNGLVTVYNASLPQQNLGTISQSILTLGYNLNSRSFALGTLTAEVGNLQWANDFPFQGKYRGITRNLNLANVIMPPNDNIQSRGFINSSANFGYGGPNIVGSPTKLGLAYMGMYEIQWDHASARNYTGFSPFEYANLVDSFTIDSADSNMTPAITKSMMTLADLNFVTGSGNTPWQQPQTLWTAPSNEMFFVHFFSFGKFLGKFAGGIMTGTLGSGSVSMTQAYGVGEEDHYHALRTGSLVGAIPNGWKYGVYHAIPSQNSITFRQGRFGQMRDMLEQRPFSKFLDRSTNTVIKPLEIKFATGSQAALTSSAWWLNTRDSGIYDTEYKSGQPYYDIENID